jgi:hypothetical protein
VLSIFVILLSPVKAQSTSSSAMATPTPVTASSASTPCCVGQGNINPTTLDADCKRLYIKSVWVSTLCPSGTSCKAYNCIATYYGVTAEPNYFQGCWTDDQVTSAIAAGKTGDSNSSTGTTCYAGLTGAGSRLSLPPSAFWLVFVVSLSAIFLRQNA